MIRKPMCLHFAENDGFVPKKTQEEISEVFENSELASSGLPEGGELKLLNQYKNDLPSEVFNKEFNLPKTDGSGFILSLIHI